MPSLNMATPHSLGQEEAQKRLKEKFTEATNAYGNQASNLQQQWDGNTHTFSFKTMGMSVSGTVTVEPAEVKLDVKLPIAAMMLKGTIEKRIRAELGSLLA